MIPAMPGPCHVCRAPVLEQLAAEPPGGWITSDFRPWAVPGARLLFCPGCGAAQKNLDAAWHEAVGAIYASYEPYPQGRRMEQVSFSQAANDAPMARSEKILRRAIATPGLPEEGRMLDIGCGDGSLIASFGRLLPGWRLNAADVGERYRDRILGLPGVEGFHSPDPERIEGPFDLITMVHVFEHIVDPIAVLRAWKRHLAPGGKLLIQVPNLLQNPFDLVILDHATHFSPDVLAATVTRAGFDCLVAADDWVAKELTLIATPGALDARTPPLDVAATRRRALAHLGWLAELAATARQACRRGRFGIFGTSIAGSWLFHAVEGRVDFFVDEDVNRVGGTHCGRPILAPAEVEAGARLFVPLPPEIAPHVGARLSALGLDVLLPGRPSP